MEPNTAIVLNHTNSTIQSNVSSPNNKKGSENIKIFSHSNFKHTEPDLTNNKGTDSDMINYSVPSSIPNPMAPFNIDSPNPMARD